MGDSDPRMRYVGYIMIAMPFIGIAVFAYLVWWTHF